MPNFECRTTEGTFMFHDFLQKQGSYGWTMLFSHPKDFTPVCTTEIGACHVLLGDFKKRGVQLIGLSCDSVENHKEWAKDVLAFQQANQNQGLGFPLIADENRTIADMLGMLDPLEVDDNKMPKPARALFLIGPDKRNWLTILYPATTGRNFAEVFRAIDSLYLSGVVEVGTPANWHPGDHVVPNLHISNSQTASQIGKAQEKVLPSGKHYLRHVEQPEVKPRQPLRHLQAVKESTAGFRVKLGAKFPDFDCISTAIGIGRFHKLVDHLQAQWTVLICWTGDFAPVATTELMACHQMVPDLKQRGAALLGLSCDSLESHQVWSKDALSLLGKEKAELGFTLIADKTQQIAFELGLLGPGIPHKDTSSARGLFVIGPDKTIRLSMSYPETTGYNFFEVLRVLDSLILTQDFQLATPANWQPGDNVIVDPAVPTNYAEHRFPGLQFSPVPSGKQYLRWVDCPSMAWQAQLPSLPPPRTLGDDTAFMPGPGTEMSKPVMKGRQSMFCGC